jgi:hypothetical protein
MERLTRILGATALTTEQSFELAKYRSQLKEVDERQRELIVEMVKLTMKQQNMINALIKELGL